jgi:predicted phage terminase large subunit-like protein
VPEFLTELTKAKQVLAEAQAVPIIGANSEHKIASQNNQPTGTLLQDLSKMDVTHIDFKTLPRADLLNLQRLLTPRMTKYIVHCPTAKQVAFLLLDCKEAFYGGAAGGGKSDALLMAGLQYVDVKDYSGIIFRKSYADLTKPGALIERAKEWLFKFDDVKWDDKNKRFNFFRKSGPHVETWSILQFGYLETTSDKYNYQGGEYQFIGFDELTHIDERSYKYMFSRLRRLKTSCVPLRVRGASNPPDDDQGIWVKTRFIDEGPAHHRVFIPAGMNDNPFLDRESYEESLDELDPVTRARLRDGNWAIIRKGNMFKRTWFQTVPEAPHGARRIRYWDMAASDPEKAAKRNKSSEPDYTVGFLMGEARGIFYVEDIIRVRKRPADTELIQKNAAIVDGYSTNIREEQEPGSSGISTIDQKSRTIFLGYNYAGNRATGSKATRAQSVSAAAERGQIKIVRGCRNVDDFFNEIESFPGGIHDDMVDGLSGSYTELAQTPMIGDPISLDSEEGSFWIDDLADAM